MQISVKNLSKTYRTWERENSFIGVIKSLFKRISKETVALQNVSFEVAKGEHVAILGPNGAGKSTLIKIMTGVLWPTEGKVTINGVEPYKSKELKYKIGVVFGQKSQLGYMVTARDSIQFIASIYDVKNWEKRFNKLAKMLKVAHLADKPVRTLSFGERMKFEIIASLIHDPEILFLDEPTIGMDVEIKEEVRNFLKKLKKTIIITSHDMGDVEEIANRVIMIHKGKKIFDGKLHELTKKYIKEKIIEVETPEKLPFKAIEHVGMYYKFKVKNKDVKKFLDKLMKFEITDLSVHNPKLEKIIVEIYKRGKV